MQRKMSSSDGSNIHNLQIIYRHPPHIPRPIPNNRHINKAPILRLEVHLWSPVVGQVLLDIASRALRCPSLVVSHREIKAIPPYDAVDVAGRNARLDDGVGALVEESAVALYNKGCGRGGSQETE